ncbi:hypothetical protein PIB30_103179, partial [Stylosanthes scabra]|nr:hypothetical protein [Stylosanthes scabra]
MPRAKQTAKRTRNEEVGHMEPPNDHPLFQYFSRLDDLNNYIFNFSERKEISPRESYYPELVAIAYSTLSIEFNEECATEFTLRFRLLKNEYE